MTQEAVAPVKQQSLITKMAAQYGIEANIFKSTIIKTLFPSDKQNPSNEIVAAFLVVASKYNLNPFIKEIYAFPGKGGGIVPIVSIDGWNTIINRQPQYDGVEFKDELDDKGNLIAITAKVFRKDRSHPVMVTEYLNECKRNTDPWKQYPARMLRHKALIQAARYAFGFSGIYDPDEAERIAEATGSVGFGEPTPIAVISEEQRTALVNLARECGVVEKIGEIITNAGFEMMAQVTVDRYDDVVDAIKVAGRPTNVPASEATVEGEIVNETNEYTEDDLPLDQEEAAESQLADLRAAVNEALIDKLGSLKSDQKTFLKGREVANESAEVLKEMLETLNTM